MYYPVSPFVCGKGCIAQGTASFEPFIGAEVGSERQKGACAVKECAGSDVRKHQNWMPFFVFNNTVCMRPHSLDLHGADPHSNQHMEQFYFIIAD